MARADIVVLHVHNMDVVPMIALAGLENRPPSMMVNHGDHQFWLGSGVVDLIVSTRDSGRQLGIDRRGVTPERSLRILKCCQGAITCVNSAADVCFVHDILRILTLAGLGSVFDVTLVCLNLRSQIFDIARQCCQV